MILVTGCRGQIGSELIPALEQEHGKEHILGIDKIDFDIRDTEKLRDVIQTKKINTVYHLVSLLSATSEQYPQDAWEVNLGSLREVLNLAVEFKLKVFWPSSIAVFGSTTPKHAPQHTILEPTTLYGVTKVSGELLCQYYRLKHGVDVRSVRFPGILSWKTPPGGGTTDYVMDMVQHTVKNIPYTCPIAADIQLPMVYIDDAIQSIKQLMSARIQDLSVTTSYNLAGVSFSPVQIQQL
jgi:nucleoside-diphosphate-sugar epimerase